MGPCSLAPVFKTLLEITIGDVAFAVAAAPRQQECGVRAAAGGEEQPSPPHRDQRARRRLVCCDGMAQLAVRGSAPRIDRIVLRECERVEVPARQPHDTRVPQRLDAARRCLRGAAAVAELPLLSVAPAVELALRSERERVGTARDAHHA
eukprot:scaffold111996_cov33-Phaeocystis_antarctica.AAC.2